MRKIIYILFCLSFIGCNYLEDYSQDLVIAKSVQDVDELLLGSGYLRYGSPDNIAGGDVGWWIHLLDDDVNGVIADHTGTHPDIYVDERLLRNTYYGYFCWQWEVGRNYQKTSLASDASLWNTLYSRINIANIILAEIQDMDKENEEDELDAWRVQGEAYFLRAQFYLFLVNIYGDAYAPSTAASKLGVPLKLTEYVEHDPDRNPQFERATVQEVYDQIVSDLENAVSCFERGSQPQSIYRASKEAALLLLSRVHLYMQNWEGARDRALEVLESKNTLAAMSFMDSVVFLSPSNVEVIFTQGVQNLKHGITGRGGEFCVSSDLYNLYDDKDVRKTCFTINTRTDSIALSFKYRTDFHQSRVSDIFTIRAAEAYLNMAEACAMMGGQDALANQYLNTLRRNRIIDYVDQSYSGEELVSQIRNERRKELCFEGHRWFDLRRYSVSNPYPYSKRIYRRYSVYTSDYVLEQTYTYVLEENDPAYVFDIPKSVKEFDVVPMPGNDRPVRNSINNE